MIEENLDDCCRVETGPQGYTGTWKQWSRFRAVEMTTTSAGQTRPSKRAPEGDFLSPLEVLETSKLGDKEAWQPGNSETWGRLSSRTHLGAVGWG